MEDYSIFDSPIENSQVSKKIIDENDYSIFDNPIDNKEYENSFNEDWDYTISEEAKKYPNIPESVVRSLINRESSGNPMADVETGGKWGKARGLGQFIDETARQYIPDWKDPSDSYDPVKNIKGIYAYLDDLNNKTGSIEKSLIKYHGGGTDILGTKSEDYANQILGNQKNKNFNPTKEDYSIFDTSTVEKPIQQEVQQPQEQTVLEGLTHAGVAGAALATKGFYSIPTGVATAGLTVSNTINKGINALFGKKIFEDQVAIPEFLTNNKLVQIPKEIYETQNKEAKKSFEGKRLLDLVKEKNIGKTAEWLGQFVLEQAPQTIGTGAMIAKNIPKIISLGLMALSTTGQKTEENKEKVKSGEVSEYQSQLDATINGILEGIFEATGEYKVLEKLTDVLKHAPDEIKNKTPGLLKNIVKGFFSGAKQGTPSEVITQISQDLTDKFTGVNSKLTTDDLINNAIEAGAGTLGMGGGMGAVTGLASTGATPKESIEEIKEPIKQSVESKSFWNRGSLENFIEEYKSVGGPARKFLMNKLTDDEKEQVKTKLKAPEKIIDEISTVTPTETAPQQLEETVGAPKKENIINREREVEKEPIKEINKEKIETSEETKNSQKVKINRKQWVNMDYDQIKQLEKTMGSNIEFEGLNELTKNLGKAISPESEKGRAEVIIPTEAEFKKIKVSEGIEVIQNKRPEYNDEKQLSEKDIEKEISSESIGKIKISRNQWNKMSSKQVSELETKLGPSIEFEGLKEMDKERQTNIKKYDSSEKGKIKVIEEENPEFVKEKIAEGIEVVRNKRPEYKIPTKYKTQELIDIAKSNNRNDIKKVKDIVSESGISLPSNKTWQSFVLEYAKRRGDEEDINNITSLIQKKNIKTSKSIKEKQQERLITTGDTRKEYRQSNDKSLKEIINDGIVEYNKDKHDFIVSIKDNKPVFKNKQYNNALEIQTIKDKQYIKVKDIILDNNKSYSGIDILQDILAKSTVNSYNENIKNNEEDINITANEELDNTEKQFETQKEEEENVVEQIFEEDEVKHATLKQRKELTKLFNSGKIDKQKYDHSIRIIKAMEQDYGIAKYDEDLSDVRYSKVGDLEEISGTKEDEKNGEKIAKKLNLQFNGINPGLKSGEKILAKPLMLFTLKDKTIGTTFPAPIGSTLEEVKLHRDNKIIQMKEGLLKDLTKEVSKVLKGLNKEDIPIVKFEKENSENQFIFGSIGNKNGKTIISINPNIDVSDILPTLLHEMLGHFGASNILNNIDPILGQHMFDLFQKDILSNFTKELRETYGNNKEILFDEWVAKNIEIISKKYFNEKGIFQEEIYNNDKSILSKVYDFIKTLVNKIFDVWFKKEATKQEIENATIALIQEMGEIKFSSDITYRSKKVKEKKSKSFTMKQRLKTYANDRLNLELVKDVENLQLRFFDFANKHFYGENAESFRNQIFEFINKVKEIGDENHKKLIEIINEFSDWTLAEKVYKDVKRFKRQHRKILDNRNSIIDFINLNLKHIEDNYQEYIDYQTLKRLKDRGLVDRRLKKGSLTEYSEPMDKYSRLLDEGLLEKESFDAGSYEISDKGIKQLKDLKEKLTNEETKNMFGVNDIEDILSQIKTKLKEYLDEKDINREQNKVEKIEKVKKIIDRIKSIKPSKITNELLKSIKEADLSTTNLEYIVNKLDDFKDDGPFTKFIFDELDKGRNKTLQIKHQVIDIMKEELSKIPKNELVRMSPELQSGIIGEIEKKSNKKIYNYKVAGIEITPAQKISIYMLSQNENGLRHLLNGGISLNHTGNITKLKAEYIKQIHNDMTKNEMIIANMYFKISNLFAEKGNKISNKDVGFDIFNEVNYHPILVRGDHINKDIKEINSLEDLREYIVKTTPSALKRRTNSNAPIVLEGVFNAYSRTSPMIEKYIGSSLSSKVVNSILNNKDFMQKMNEKGLDIEYKMIRKLVNNVSGDILRIPQGGETVFRTVQNLFTTAALGYKLSTIMIQPTAYFSYLTSIPDLTAIQKLTLTAKGGIGVIPSEYDRIKEMIMKYSPSLRERFSGHGDYAVGEQMKSSEARNRVTGGKSGWRKLLSSEGALAPMIEIDRRTIALIWKAVEEELKMRKTSLIGETLNRAIAKKTNDVVRRTQATSDTLDRPDVMNSMLLKPLTMFTSEPIKRMMMVRRALNNLKEPKTREKAIGDIAILMVFQPIMVEVIRTSVLMLRGKDDMPEYEKDWLLWFLKRIAINNVGMYPILGTMAATAFSGFDVNIGGPTQEIVNRFIAFSKSAWESAKEGQLNEKTIKSLRRLSEMLAPVQSGVIAKEIIDNMIEQLENL